MKLISNNSLHTLIDEKFTYINSTDGLWSVVTTTDGFATVGDTHGGVCNVSSAVNDAGDGGNETTILSSRHELVLFQDDAPMVFESCLAVDGETESNFFIGTSDVNADGLLVDDGGGLIATACDAAGFLKVDGEDVWRCISSNATTRTSTTTTVATTDTNKHLFRIEFRAINSTTGEIAFYIDGVFLAKHSITLTGLAEMHVIPVAAKSGTATQAATADVSRCLVRVVDPDYPMAA